MADVQALFDRFHQEIRTYYEINETLRTALEAAELATYVLSDSDPGRPGKPGKAGSVLVTWRGDRTEFESAGYRLSSRAAVIAAGARIRVSGAMLVRPGCLVCGSLAPSTPVTGGREDGR
jgi:hypothetical protein